MHTDFRMQLEVSSCIRGYIYITFNCTAQNLVSHNALRNLMLSHALNNCIICHRWWCSTSIFTSFYHFTLLGCCFMGTGGIGTPQVSTFSQEECASELRMYMLKSRQQMPPNGSCANVDTFFCLQSIVFFFSMESNTEISKYWITLSKTTLPCGSWSLTYFIPLSSWHFCANLWRRELRMLLNVGIIHVKGSSKLFSPH